MKSKLVGLFAATLLLAGAVSALNIQVEVDTISKMNTYFLKYDNRTEDLQRINLTVENTGSIGCKYRIKGVFHYKNYSEVRFSRPYDVWPGGVETAEMRFMPENYTGRVKAEIYSYFCERQEFVENISYIQEEKILVSGKVGSETLTADEDMAEVELDQEKGVLLPRDTPPYWKVGSARIRNGSAVLRYDPPIFSEKENLNFTVIGPGDSVRGVAQVSLETEKTKLEKFMETAPRVLAILLFFSVVLNSRLLLEIRRRQN